MRRPATIFTTKTALIISVLALAIGLQPIISSGAWADAPSAVTVCPDGSCDYATIQSAIDGTPVGGLIRVEQGDYAESLTIPKALTITADAGSRLDGGAQGPLVSILSTGVTISGLTIGPSTGTISPSTGVSTTGYGVSLQNVTFSHLALGLYAVGGGNVLLQGAMLEAGASLAHIYGSTNVLISGSRVSGMLADPFALVRLGGLNHVRIDGNSFTSDAGGTALAFVAEDDALATLPSSTDVSVAQNSFTGFSTAINVATGAVHDPMTPVSGNLFGGDVIGVSSEAGNDPSLIDASGNFWGSPEGPGSRAMNVTAGSWCADAACLVQTSSVSPTDPTTPGKGGGPATDTTAPPTPVAPATPAAPAPVVMAAAPTRTDRSAVTATGTQTAPALLANPTATSGGDVALAEPTTDSSSSDGALGGQTQVDTNTQGVPEIAGNANASQAGKLFGVAWYWWALIVILLVAAGLQVIRGIRVDRARR